MKITVNDFYLDHMRSDEYGVVARWKINNRIPFDDMLETFAKRGWITRQEFDNSNHLRGIEDFWQALEYVRGGNPLTSKS